jgi:hypothetical protein
LLSTPASKSAFLLITSFCEGLFSQKNRGPLEVQIDMASRGDSGWKVGESNLQAMAQPFDVGFLFRAVGMV